jgi:hypothetical protein
MFQWFYTKGDRKLGPVDTATLKQLAASGELRPNSGTMPLLVKLAMRAVQDLGWKLENANEHLGLVTFETGMSWGSWSGISCSLNIEEVSTNQFRVTGTAKQNVRGGQFLAINFGGEAQSKVRKAIDKMQELTR